MKHTICPLGQSRLATNTTTIAKATVFDRPIHVFMMRVPKTFLGLRAQFAESFIPIAGPHLVASCLVPNFVSVSQQDLEGNESALLGNWLSGCEVCAEACLKWRALIIPAQCRAHYAAMPIGFRTAR